MTMPAPLPRSPSLPLSAAFLALALATAVGEASAQTGNSEALGQPRVSGAPTLDPEGREPASVDPALFQGLHFRMVGPTRGGRVTTVAGHPAHPHTFYFGGVGGGVWKTDDAGQSWRILSDGYFETGSIGAIRVAPSNPDILYVGTGSDGIRSNVIHGLGVYKSTGAGESWSFAGLREVGQIGAVEVHPANPGIVFVAAMGNAFKPTPDRGVYKSTDGGRSWRKVLFTSDSVGAVDLELHPTDPQVLYAALYRGERKPWTIISGMEASGRENGIWKSTDGGESWRLVTRGLPTGLIGKIDLAVSPADPHRVYAVVEADEPMEGLYRSDDQGESWTLVSNQPGLMNRPFYYTNVDADPTDADIVWVNNETLWKSADGGRTFSRFPTPHGDNHDMWINPDDPDIFIQANDGGVNVTLNGGRTWSTQMNQATAELYQVDLDDRFPYWLYAGQQDNTTIMLPSNPPEDGSVFGPQGNWKEVGGCETGPVVPKPGNPSIVYANCKGRFGRYSQLTGQEQQYYVWAGNLYGTNPADLPYRFQRVAPIEVSPHDPDLVYHGSQYVHRTTDDGRTWETISPDLTAFPPERQMVSGGPITRDATGEEHFSTLYVIEESPVQAGVIWTGANDGPVHVTRDGGKSWTNVTPPMPPEGRIQTIDPSPHRAGKAYVAAYRYLLGDFEPYIFKTEDFGATWERLTTGSNGIPADYPTRVVREDPDREGLLYAGTEFGLFISFDDGRRWQSFQLDLPVTPVTDIKVYRQDLVLSTMGRSFWIMDNVTPLHEIKDGVDAARPHLFTPRPAYRLWGRGGSSPAARARGEPEYSPVGAAIDYYLPSGAAPGVTLEILDGAGGVIRSFTGSALPSTPGMHRFIWDLRHGGAAGAPRGGSVAVPGDYQVRLTPGGWSETRPLKLLMDPRVVADGVTLEDLKTQFAFNLQVRALQEEAAELSQRVQRALQEGGGGRAGSQARTELTAIRDLLVTAGGSYPQPMLLAQIQYLASMMGRADQPPGNYAHLRLEELRGQLAGLQARAARTLREDRP